MRQAFGDCVLDTERRELERGGAPVALTPKAYRLLEILLERRPKALSKQDLMDALWPGLYVSESGLTNLIAQVRAAIGDEVRPPELVRTLHGFGYAFKGEVTMLGPAGPTSTCRLLWGEREVALQLGANVLGRAPESAVWIPDDQVSRHHARIVVGPEGAVLEDLGSHNGTFHRGQRIDSPVTLADGDVILLGGVTLTVRLASGAGSTVTSLEP